jgi:hypothetical protein
LEGCLSRRNRSSGGQRCSPGGAGSSGDKGVFQEEPSLSPERLFSRRNRSSEDEGFLQEQRLLRGEKVFSRRNGSSEEKRLFSREERLLRGEKVALQEERLLRGEKVVLQGGSDPQRTKVFSRRKRSSDEKGLFPGGTDPQGDIRSQSGTQTMAATSLNSRRCLVKFIPPSVDSYR